ncbi:GNAT family N-acetyltransferase [Ochrobactrum teleogrylli]|uniref:GNAT family N-acetyltransferase n=1 Tax=Ochrobactrum teleogrylli TaxID=2479765 RepID=A0ABY2Y9P8_9HYPH|nr:GNAT family N-acetyltransferase [[Ochrobactrum] teleogrylli]TNV18271.1 GNAT family N-acetyltransferase [[Ochrobactrum] teleogrylli]
MTDPDPSSGAVRLQTVTDDLRSRVTALELAPGQENLVADNASSLEEADEDEDARPRAVFAGDILVGFLMYDATSDGDNAQIYRFMIDRAFQGWGYGKAALQLVLAEIRALDHIRRISICYEPENEGARQLYAKAGFVEDGLDEDGEMIAHLDLRD